MHPETNRMCYRYRLEPRLCGNLVGVVQKQASIVSWAEPDNTPTL